MSFLTPRVLELDVVVIPVADGTDLEGPRRFFRHGEVATARTGEADRVFCAKVGRQLVVRVHGLRVYGANKAPKPSSYARTWREDV